MQMSPETASSQERKKIGPVNRGLRLINPDGKDAEEVEHEIRGREPGSQYAPMRAHKELASQVIAVGGTYRMAARYAGISRRMIHKYMQDPRFRARIEEHRAQMASGIKGRILGELGRRTKGKAIHSWDIMDMVRVLDRLTGAGGKGMITVEGDLNVNNNKYEAILASLFSEPKQIADSGEDGGDFPRFGDSSNVIPGESTSVDS